MIGPQELQTFIETPERFANGANLPECLPVRRTPEEIKAMFPAQIELRGYCPVTLKSGEPGFSSLLLGSNDYVAEFGGKLYAMESEEKLAQFMRYAVLYGKRLGLSTNHFLIKTILEVR
jgi:adenylate/nucleoside-diphosphate kinase